MFRVSGRKSHLMGVLALGELIFHVGVRNLRKQNRNAALGLVISILQSLIAVLIFWGLFTVLKMRGGAVRGDFMLYVMSGIFMFMTHTKTLSAVAKCDGPTSSMMQHAPMNTIVAIAAAALATLYQQILAIAVLLFFYHVLFNPVTIDQPIGALLMVLLAWASGIGVGMIFKGAAPWAPDFFPLLATIYARANIIASGKMFLANAMPTAKLEWFWWNPLFHVIDQTRGFVFLNYNPHYSSVIYPLQVTFVLVIVGLMFEHFTSSRASLSWSAGR